MTWRECIVRAGRARGLTERELARLGAIVAGPGADNEIAPEDEAEFIKIAMEAYEEAPRAN